MLKTRIISSMIGLILIIGAIIISSKTFAVAVFLLALLGIHEFYTSMNNLGYKPVKPIGYVLCVLIIMAGFKEIITAEFSDTSGIVMFLVFIFIFVLVTLPVFKYGKYNAVDISITLYGVFYVIFLFMFLVLTRSLEHGSYYIWLILIGAWSTDTFAYAGGSLFGKQKKNKLAPNLSPNKTVEGFVSGIIGSILMLSIYGIYLQSNLNPIPFYHYIIIGLLCGIISQVGDLVASSTKRYTKVKDFGRIIPGHGGVLDRFDSVLLTAPVVYFYLTFFII